MHALLIGYDDPFPPFAETGPDGRARGLLIDRVRAILDAAGLGYRFVALTLDRAEALLAAGEVDALAVKAITDDRRPRIRFSAPIMRTGAALFVPPGHPVAAHHDIARCSGLRIATPRGGPLTAMVTRACSGATLVPTTSYEESLAAVLDGGADVAALNVHGGAASADRLFPGRFARPQRTFAELSFGIAFDRARSLTRAGDRIDTILAAVDRAIAALPAA